jgi:hypothetical protein
MRAIRLGRVLYPTQTGGMTVSGREWQWAFGRAQGIPRHLAKWGNELRQNVQDAGPSCRYPRSRYPPAHEPFCTGRERWLHHPRQTAQRSFAPAAGGDFPQNGSCRTVRTQKREWPSCEMAFSTVWARAQRTFFKPPKLRPTLTIRTDLSSAVATSFGCVGRPALRMNG